MELLLEFVTFIFEIGFILFFLQLRRRDVRVPFGQLEIIFFGKIKSAINRCFVFKLKRNFEEKWWHYYFSFFCMK